MLKNPEYVYSISCPVTNHVVYVGKTCNPDMRWNGHCSTTYTLVGMWIKAMKSIGFNPIFKIIDCTYGDISKLERQYISYYISLNQAQHNTHGNPKQRVCIAPYWISVRKADGYLPLIKSKRERTLRLAEILNSRYFYLMAPDYLIKQIERYVSTAVRY